MGARRSLKKRTARPVAAQIEPGAARARQGRPWVVAVAAVALAAGGAAVALAAHPKVDPAAVPVGFFTAHSQMNSIPVSAIEKVLKTGKADGFTQHERLAPGQAT